MNARDRDREDEREVGAEGVWVEAPLLLSDLCVHITQPVPRAR